MRGGQPYYYPVGFLGIGLHVNNFDENTCVAYHGTLIRNIPSILYNGFKLPNELYIHRTTHLNLTLTYFGIPNHANAIFVSPSWRYASFYGLNRNIYSRNMTIYVERGHIEDTKFKIVLLQVRVRLNSFTVHTNTTFYEVNDPNYRNEQIEWRIQNPNDVFPYRILIKTISHRELNQLFQRRDS